MELPSSISEVSSALNFIEVNFTDSQALITITICAGHFWHCRADYSPAHDLLEQEFLLKGRKYVRKDMQAR